MKILMDGMPGNIGGIGTLLINIINYNIQIGNADKYVFECLIPEGSKYKEILDARKIKYYEAPRMTSFLKYRKFLKTVFEKKYDFVWINNTSKFNLLLLIYAKKIAHARIIQHSHGVDIEETGIKRRVFEGLTFVFGGIYERMIDYSLACSKASADFFYKNPNNRSSCEVMHNGIFTDRFLFNASVRDKIRNELAINSNDILLGAVGRITKVKNYSFLVDLISNLPNNYKCVVLGDGEEYDHLEKKIDDKNVSERFLLLGKRNNVEEYLSAMDIFVMPSLNEGLPFSAIEAQANGLRCLVSTGVSKEINISGNVAFVDIASLEEWKKKCLGFRSDIKDRNRGAEAVIQSGYSIKTSYKLFEDCIHRRGSK